LICNSILIKTTIHPTQERPIKMPTKKELQMENETIKEGTMKLVGDLEVKIQKQRDTLKESYDTGMEMLERIKELEKENDMLKEEQVINCIDELMKKVLSKLENEKNRNEELKAENEELKGVSRCKNCNGVLDRINDTIETLVGVEGEFCDYTCVVDYETDGFGWDGKA